jgi:sarcosine oxidase subunit alpha
MRFRFQEREIEARVGDTIAVALYRAGQRIFSRSFKYHRPRGLLCAAGKCPNCLMNVDGTPNVRTCITPVRAGMRVRPQNAKPSLEHDWLAVTERFAWLMPVGWYYKTFQNPKVWHSVEPFIRRVAGLGEVGPTAHQEYEHTWMHTETAVVGADTRAFMLLSARPNGESVSRSLMISSISAGKLAIAVRPAAFPPISLPGSSPARTWRY